MSAKAEVVQPDGATRDVPRFRSPRAGIAPQTRARIEQAVIEAFSRREFHRVNLIDIARGANVSLQTLYKYYGSKEALLFCSLDAVLRQLQVRMLDHLQGIENYKERLRKVFWVMLDFVERRPDVIQVLMSSVYLNTWRRQDSFQNPELFGPFIRVLGEGRMRGVLDDSVDEKLLLDFFFGFLFRLAHMHIHRGGGESLTGQSNALFEMLWRAIAKPSMPAV